MLELYAERAGLADGQRILELGCGWGSFCLWAAERWPRSRDRRRLQLPHPARVHRGARPPSSGSDNLTVLTADITTFDPADLGEPGPFDRIVSIEMLEHVSNHEELFGRIARWLAPDGRFFTHIFTGNDVAFAYDADDPRDWMGRYFFSGGLMPSDDWFLHLQSDLVCVDHWQLVGDALRADRQRLDRQPPRPPRRDPRRARRRRRRAATPRSGSAAGPRSSWAAPSSGATATASDFGVSHYLFEPAPLPDPAAPSVLPSAA